LRGGHFLVKSPFYFNNLGSTFCGLGYLYRTFHIAVSFLSIALIVILSVHIFYLALLAGAFFRPLRPPSTPSLPLSVIVCAHDEERNLKELIPLLLAQQYPEYEVIIVDDRSNDNTYDYLLEATKQYSQLKMVKVRDTPAHVNGKKFGITLAVKAARYDWVVFTDADCRPHGTAWLSEMSRRFSQDKSIVLGVSLYQRKPGLLNSFIRFESLLTATQYIGWALLGYPYMGVGRNMAYRKNLFIDNKGFNDHLSVMGGDDDLFVNQHATAQNTTTAIGADALVLSKPKQTWADFYYQKIRHLAVGKKYRGKHKLMLGMFTLTWIFTWLLVAPLAFFSSLWQWVLAVFLVREVLLIILVHKASRRFGEPFESWKTPLLDFIYAFYYLVAGPVALLTKKVRWKN
jgi:cellulose synthase/poly-beta-1,6-N-acetylglucosamine synthase-like glycosyltransferase